MHLFWLLKYLTIAAIAVKEIQGRAYIPRYDDKESFQSGVCQTKHCQEMGRNILQSLNTSVDPCEDFYSYACGSWSKHNPVPDTELEWSQDHKITQKTYNRIRDILEQDDKPNDLPPVKMVRRFYRSCMDEEKIEEIGIQPLLDIINKTGGWPLAMPLGAWHKQNIVWQDVDKEYIALIGNSAFFNLGYEHNENHTRQNILSIDLDVGHPLNSKRPDPDLPFSFGDYYMNGILKVATKIAAAQNYTINQRQLGQDIIDMVFFEVALEQIISEEKEKRQFHKEHIRLTIQELQDWYDSFGIESSTAKIDFLEITRFVFKKGNIEINASEPIVVYNEKCLEKIANLLGKTRERVIVNYIQWNIIHNFMFYTNEEMRKIKYDIYYSKYNIKSIPPRWKSCISLMEMKDAISYLFVKGYVKDDMLRSVSKMIDNVQDALEIQVMRAVWLPSEMKSSLKDKLNNMIRQIGYPAWYKNDTALIEFYKDLEISDNFFENVINSFKHFILQYRQKFRLETNRNTEWPDYPITVNAFYSETTNAIILPAAELQEPYFTEFLPDAINYGAVGFVIGHEMSHSFDNDGILHDEQGNKIRVMADENLSGYSSRTECFRKQFDNYLIDYDQWGEAVMVDGETTQDENIADSTGIQAAYIAYQLAKKKRPKTWRLPGLEHISDDKLFFLSYANSWCESRNADYALVMSQNDDHSPSKYRVIGALANMKEFSETFNCPDNTEMNREEKCSLWK